MIARQQDGSLAAVQATVLLVIVVMGGIVALDVGALLRAARVATAAADGAALAASAASQPVSRAAPRVAAARVARGHGAQLDTCECAGPRSHVAVTLPVATRLLDHLGITEVRAEATADLVPVPASTAGPTPCARGCALGPRSGGVSRNSRLVHSLGLVGRLDASRDPLMTRPLLHVH